MKKRIRSNRENASGSQSPQRGEMGQGEVTSGQKGVLPAALLPQTVPTKSHLLRGRSGAAYPSVSPHSVGVPTRLPGAHALWRQTLLCSDREATQFVFVILPQQQALPCFPNKTVPPLCPSRKKRSCLGSLQPCMVGRAPRRGAQVPKGTAARQAGFRGGRGCGPRVLMVLTLPSSPMGIRNQLNELYSPMTGGWKQAHPLSPHLSAPVPSRTLRTQVQVLVLSGPPGRSPPFSHLLSGLHNTHLHLKRSSPFCSGKSPGSPQEDVNYCEPLSQSEEGRKEGLPGRSRARVHPLAPESRQAGPWLCWDRSRPEQSARARDPGAC